MKRFLFTLIFLALALPLWAATQDLRLTTTWTDNSNNEDGFKVELKIGAGAYSVVNTTAPNQTSFSIDVLGDVGNVSYCMRQVAFNSAGDAAPSAEACQTSPQIIVVTVPNSASGTTLLIEVLKIDPQGVVGKPGITLRKAPAPTKAKAPPKK